MDECGRTDELGVGSDDDDDDQVRLGERILDSGLDTR